MAVRRPCFSEAPEANEAAEVEQAPPAARSLQGENWSLNSEGAVTPFRLPDPPSSVAAVPIPVQKVDGRQVQAQADVLAVEEPLEIRLRFGPAEARRQQAVSVTMRTPGHDLELAVGFLWTEGILTAPEQLQQVRHCGPPGSTGHPNVIRVDLQPEVAVDLNRLERHFYTTSSCGVCGKTSLEAVRVRHRPPLAEGQPLLDPDVIHRLPEALRAAQSVFDRTGGLHAAGLFDAQGRLLCLREDVGRHNALDKLIGAQVLARNLPLSQHVLLLSGRACFELVQKAVMAGVPVLAAVGAPSSLAVDLARDCGMTVLGFVRNGRFNIYAGAGRIRDAGAVAAGPARRSLPVLH
jgi:FdhD protein